MEGSGGGGKELVFERVRFAYDWGTPFALNDFTVGFSPGEVTALLGPNGSGKTTMMKLANRRLVPTMVNYLVVLAVNEAINYLF